MELKYRGAAYQPAGEAESHEDTQQMGISRHQGSENHKSVKASLRKPGEELIYRGVRYTR